MDLGGSWAQFGKGLGRSGASFGRSWATFVHFFDALNDVFFKHGSKTTPRHFLDQLWKGRGRIWEGFGEGLGSFWETKILDFHTFFDVFSKSFSKHAREEQKIDPRSLQVRKLRFFASGFWWSPPSWGEKKGGDQDQELGLSD